MNNRQKEMAEIELVIGKILRIGVLISAVILMVGLVVSLLHNGTDYPAHEVPTDFKAILKGVLQFKAGAIMMVGLFCLILTPVLRVVVSIYAFFKEQDYLYVAITVIVLIILMVGMLLGFMQ